MPDINLSPYTAQQQAIDRRRKMAELLQQQAATPMETPTAPGVTISPLAGLAKLLQGYGAGKRLEKIDAEQKEYEANTMADFAKIFGLAGQKETVPGAVTSPAVPSAPIPENINRQAELARLNQPEAGFEAQANIGRTLMRPQDVQQIQNLPTSTAAVPEVRAPDQQVPMLKAEMLTDPKFTKTSAGRMMLAQALMQQRAQEQAAAQAELAASRQLQAFNPEQNVGTFSGGKFNTLIQGQPKPLTEYQNYDLQLKDAANRVNAAKVEDVTGVKQEPYKLLPPGIPFGAVESGKQTPDGRTIYKKDGKFYVEGK
jgi:hypothetical protein